MFKILGRLLALLFWWIVVAACVAFIGYIAWPLLSEKFYTLCSARSGWRWCQADWASQTQSDKAQGTLEGKMGSFFDIARKALHDVMSDDGGKKKGEYKLDPATETYKTQ